MFSYFCLFLVNLLIPLYWICGHLFLKSWSAPRVPTLQKPWENETSDQVRSGFYIGQGRILTNARRWWGLVLKMREYNIYGNVSTYAAKVKHIARDLDLAILEIEESKVLDGLKALKFGGVPSLQEKVETVGYPMGASRFLLPKASCLVSAIVLMFIRVAIHIY